MLIAFRLLQGLGGGFVLPIAMAYVYRLAPPERVGVVMGVMGIPILLAPALGPVVAGWLVQYHSWRWIFLLNLPIGIMGVFLGIRTLPRIERQTVAALDLPGTILGPLAFAALSYGISQGSTSWTSGKTLGGLSVGVIALAAFIAVELRTRTPLLELRVFRSRDFDLAMVAQSVAQFALFGTLFLVPLFLQQLRGYGAFDTGLILLPQAVAAALLMPLGGTLYDRIGARPLVVVGLGVVAVAAFILAHVGATTRGTALLLPLGLTGAGMGLMMMALNTHLISASPRNLVSRVTSLTNALQQVVTSFAVAGLATILTSRTTFHMNAVRAGFFAKHPALATGKASKGAAAQLGHQLQTLLTGAFAKAFDDTFLVLVGMAIVAALIGLALRRNPAPHEIGQEEPAQQAVESFSTGTAFPV
jgi:EmrB/QacA subfamily drug resistance transporter